MSIAPTDEFFDDDDLTDDAVYTSPVGEVSSIKVIYDRSYREMDVNENIVASYTPEAWARTSDLTDVDESGIAYLTVGSSAFRIVTVEHDGHGVTRMTLNLT